jgi:cation diffusion facilitator family transporter
LRRRTAKKPAAFRATVVNIVSNSLLFILKFSAALLSGSIALLSDAFNSLTDIVSSAAVFVCVKISDKEADEGHPFGHSRAEPVAGIVVAILAGILGFEVIRTSLERLAIGAEVEIKTFALLVPVITAAAKGAMTLYFRTVGKSVNSPAIMAISADSFCDVFVALAALTGIVGARLGYPAFDPAAGLAISLWIIYTGYKIGMENIDYLMGKSPPASLLEEIKKAALAIEGVKNINTVRAHYVGPYIHVELHAEVPKYLSTYDSHAIGKAVERAIEKIGAIEKAFIHIDPV